jgi:adenine deaminase
MTRFRTRWLSFLILALLSILPARSQHLIYDVTIVDVETGKLIKDAAVYVDKGKIQDIGSSLQLQKKYRKTSSINGAGKYLIPGLWDMHIHLEGTALIKDNEALMPIFLAYGITTVRDCASDLGLGTHLAG